MNVFVRWTSFTCVPHRASCVVWIRLSRAKAFSSAARASAIWSASGIDATDSS